MRRACEPREEFMRQQREGPIRQVLRSMQVSLAAFFASSVRDRRLRPGFFCPRPFFRPAPARRSPYAVPTDANLRTPDRLRSDATQELSPCAKNQDAASTTLRRHRLVDPLVCFFASGFKEAM